MLTTRCILSMFSAAMMVLGVGIAFGQTTSTGSGQAYPNKPVRIFTTSAGGSNDVPARLIAQEISGPLGQPVIIENRVSNVVQQLVAKAPPDGYSLLLAGIDVVIGHVLPGAPHDPESEFEPISLVSISPLLLVVHPSLPVKSVKELIALAKARPGALNYASGGEGGANHLATELFKSMAGGVNIVKVNYRSSQVAIIGLLSGESEVMIVTSTTVTPHLKSGKLRALAVTSAQPSALVPGSPTVAASVPGYEWVQTSVIVAPAKTPTVIISRLNQEIVRALNQPDVKQKLLSNGAEAVGSSPKELAAAIKAQIARTSKVMKDADIKI